MKGFSRNTSDESLEDEIYRLRSSIKSFFKTNNRLCSIQVSRNLSVNAVLG